jgi:hypothetical protein
MPHESSTPSEIQNAAPGRVERGEVIGTRDLCAWTTAPGFTWVQTRRPDYARKLSRRSDAQLVARGVAGGFLRTFCFHHSLRWARGLIARYNAGETVTNARKTAPESPAAGERAEVRDR